MARAAHFVFELVNDVVAVEIDDVDEAPFVRIGVCRDEVASLQPAIRPAEVRDVDLDVMTVVCRQRVGSLSKNQALTQADGNPHEGARGIDCDIGSCREDFGIEARGCDLGAEKIGLAFTGCKSLGRDQRAPSELPAAADQAPQF